MKEFWSNGNFMFSIWASSDSVSFQTNEVPSLDKMKGKKVIMIVKAKQDRSVEITDKNVGGELIMMEVNRQLLDNLYLVC